MKFYLAAFFVALFLLGTVLLAPSSGEAGEDTLVIIANKSVPVSSISASEVVHDRRVERRAASACADSASLRGFRPGM